VASFLQTPQGDLSVTLGKFALVTDPATAGAAKIRNEFNVFLGEWFLDSRIGVPYFSQVFITNPNIPLIQQLLLGVILNTAGIASCQKITVSFNRDTRTLAVTFEATWDDGTIVTSDDLDAPFLVQIPSNNTVAA
jgi:hypothetical protein